MSPGSFSGGALVTMIEPTGMNQVLTAISQITSTFEVDGAGASRGSSGSSFDDALAAADTTAEPATAGLDASLAAGPMSTSPGLGVTSDPALIALLSSPLPATSSADGASSGVEGSVPLLASLSSPASVPTGTGIEASPVRLASVFARATAQYDLPPGLLEAVATQESGMNPNAVSSAGAEGIMQIMPATAASNGIADPFDPTEAIFGAAKILAGNIAYFHSVPLALAAYNAGAGAVEEYGGIPPYAQTEDYVASIMAMMGGEP